MATRIYESFVAVNCAGDYTGFRNFWAADPAETNPWRNANKLLTNMVSGSLGTDWIPTLLDILADDCFVQSIRTRQVFPTAGATAAKVFAPDEQPGAFGDDVGGNQVAGVAVWLTASQNGISARNFIPGVAESAIVGGRFSAAYLAAYLIFQQAMLDGIQTDDGNYRLTGKFKAPNGFLQIANGYLSPNPGTQRRRLVPW